MSAITDVAEELVTNALYDAPVEAGYFKASIPRSEDVELPPEHACEISYGIGKAASSSASVIRLVRSREVDCSGCSTGATRPAYRSTSRGGAGLGLWRVFVRLDDRHLP
jgi:hypothetical protein